MKTEALISFAVTVKLICAFVFAYADCWFSHGVAHLLYVQGFCLFITKTCPYDIHIFPKVVKIENFQFKNFDNFLIFAQNINCGYTLEPPRRGGSIEYPQSMYWSQNN